MTTPIKLNGPDIDKIVGECLGVEPTEWHVLENGYRFSALTFDTKAEAEAYLDGAPPEYTTLGIHAPYHRSVDACLEGCKANLIELEIRLAYWSNNPGFTIEVWKNEANANSIRLQGHDLPQLLCKAILWHFGKEIEP